MSLDAKSAAGASFTSSGHPADSMAMSVLTGVGLLCYAASLYLLGTLATLDSLVISAMKPQASAARMDWR